MSYRFWSVAAACLLGIVLAAQATQSLPRLEGRALNGENVALPDAARYRAMVLVFGFTHKSADQADAWGKRLAKDYASHPEVAYFELPVLQSAPGFVRPMIVRGMRKGTPVSEQAHVLPLDKHEDELKKLVGYKEVDDAYVVVANSEGKIMWQTHGGVTDAKYEELVRAVSALKGSDGK